MRRLATAPRCRGLTPRAAALYPQQRPLPCQFTTVRSVTRAAAQTVPHPKLTRGVACAVPNPTSIPAVAPSVVGAEAEAVAVAEDSSIDRRVWPVAAMVLIKGIAFGCWLPVISTFGVSLGLTTSQIGLVSSIGGVVRLFSNFPAAVVVQQYARIPVLVISQAIGGLALVGHALSTSLAPLLMWRSLFCVVSCFHYSASQEYVVDVSKPSNRARTQAPVAAAWNTGFAVGPAVGCFVAEAYSAGAPFVMSGGMLVAAAAITYLFTSETRPERRFAFSDRWRFAEAARPVQGSAASGPAKSAATVIAEWGPLLRHNSAVRGACATQSLIWIATSGPQTIFLPIHCTSQGFSLSQVGVVFMVMSFASLGSAPVAANVSDRWGRKWAVVPGMLLGATAASAVPMATDMTQLGVVACLWAAGGTLSHAGLFPYVQDAVPAEKRGAALAVFRTSMDMGIALGGVVFAAVVQHTSMPVSFQVCGVMYAVAAAAFAFFAPTASA